jgi:magnesium chelatase family protein
VAKARQVSLARLAGTPWTRNVQVPAQWIRQELRGDRTVLEPVDAALDAGLLSVRGADRTLRLALSVADLAGHQTPTHEDIEQALALRTGRSTRVTTLTHGGAR